MNRPRLFKIGASVLVAVVACGLLQPAPAPAQTAAGTSTAPLAWGPAVNIDPPSGQPSAVACAGARFCVAVDRTGHAVVRRDGKWLRPRNVARGDTNFTSVDCYAAGRCTALTGDGQLYRLADGRWHSWQKAPHTAALDVSCATRNFCGVIGDGHAAVWQGGAWHRRTLRSSDTSREQVSCGARGVCMFALALRSGRDWAWRFAQGHFGTRRWLGRQASGPVKGLDCIGRRWCLARQEINGVERFNGRRWITISDTAPELDVSSVSCSFRTSCVAIGTADMKHGTVAAEETYDGRRWTYPTALPLRADPNLALGCAVESRFCVAIAGNGHSVTRTRHGWSHRAQLADRSWDELTGVSCASTTLCVATTLFYGYSVFGGNRWTRLHAMSQSPNYTGYNATRLPMCVAAQDCLEEDYDGQMRRFDGATWTTMRSRVSPATDVSCGAARFCMGLDMFGRVHLLDGLRWRIIRRSFPSEGVHLTCTRGFCMVLTENGRFDTYTRSTRRWSGFARFAPRSVTPLDGPAVSCVTRTFCMEVDGSQYDSIWDGSKWRRIAAPGGYSGAVYCLSSEFCVASSNAAVVQWNGASWSPPTTVFSSPREEVDYVSCAGTAAEPRCAAIGFRHVVTTR